METIFHEKQQGSLCAQHCLNTLLQGPYFSAIELSELAKQMDEEERLKLAEGGKDSEDYRKFMEAPSQNFDDSGFFSVQTIEKALKVWDLEMIPFNSKSSEIAIEYNQNPAKAQAFICNFREHWYTIRKLGRQWFNLNSMNPKPTPVTDTYLSLLLKQLQTEGYSIFIITGNLPPCVADQHLLDNPLPHSSFVQAASPSAASTIAVKGDDYDDEDEETDMNLARALEQSYLDSIQSEEQQLELALKMSLQGSSNSSNL